MNYDEFLAQVIEQGIQGARSDYGNTQESHRQKKLEGSIEGFEACRGKSPQEILQLLAQAHQRTQEAFARVHADEISSDEYWRVRCREAEIEWIANVVSAMLVNQGLDPIVTPTYRGVMQAARILEGGHP
jgi:hypothetical protein